MLVGARSVVQVSIEGLLLDQYVDGGRWLGLCHQDKLRKLVKAALDRSPLLQFVLEHVDGVNGATLRKQLHILLLVHEVFDDSDLLAGEELSLLPSEPT